ncbi:MAG TPA: hypothetical protein VFB35_09250 [Gaiellaceae bacterium]|nr:hypothetical protein [Gaiellaceae bacterium]
MTRVVFTIGSNPELSSVQALDLAEMLIRRRTAAAFSLGARIRGALDPDRRSEAVTALIKPSPEQLEEIAAVLDESAVLTGPAFANLRSEIGRGADPPPEPQVPEGHGLRPPRTAQPAPVAEETAEDGLLAGETRGRRAS